jgi:antirestriction protein ArdC
MKAAAVMADIVDRLIAEIENGAAEWRMPWNTATGLPHNAVTGNVYRGGNIIGLWLEAAERGYTSAGWATYKQWQSVDAQVRKGERGTRLVKWIENKADTESSKVADTAVGDAKRGRLIPVSFSVFNLAQCDTAANTATVDPTPRHEGNFAHFFDAVPATIRWGAGNPCYLPDLDEVRMPEWEAFHSTAAGHATLAHELAHWTAHPSRLDRDLTGRYGDDSYAMEELIAEMSAAFTCAEVGIAPAIRDDHAPYLDHWLRVLKAEPRHLWSVASTAQAATDHLASYSTPATATQRVA